MNSYNPTMGDLFSQLGLAGDKDSINDFIDEYKGLSSQVHIENADFWTPAQASFIKSALKEDAEWVELIDQLSTALR